VVLAAILLNQLKFTWWRI